MFEPYGPFEEAWSTAKLTLDAGHLKAPCRQAQLSTDEGVLIHLRSFGLYRPMGDGLKSFGARLRFPNDSNF